MNTPINPEQWLQAMAEKVEAEGPQTLAVDGHAPLTLVSENSYRLLSERKPTFKEWLLTGPRVDDVEIERDQRPGRDFSF